MASMQHEGLLLLFRNRPTLAPELLRDALGVPLPAWSEARVESAELTQVVPTEYRADLVVLLLEGQPIFAIVVEVQLARDDGKWMSWPVYLASLRARVGCPTALLVVAPDATVARWCARPIELGHPGFVLRPLVTGPDAIPIITDEQAAREDPELAVLSAMAHGQQEVGEAIAHAVLSAVVGLEAERVRLYVDLALSSLSEVARAALEALMRSGNYEYQSEFARKYVAQGREEGRQEGRQEGETGALFEVLDARGLEVDDDARGRILACTEPAQLKLWLRKAVTVKSVQDLFEPESVSKPTARKASKSGRSAQARKPRSR
jgi:hypothetical protein